MDADSVRREHPDYQAQYRELRFKRENYEGSGGYAPYLQDVMVDDKTPDDHQSGTLSISARRTHLFRHPREKKKFERRMMMAYLVNVIKSALDMVTGYLVKQQPVYDSYPKPIKDWMSVVTAKGDTWEQYKEQEIVPKTLYYGWLPVIFYRPAVDGVTLHQQEAAGGSLQVGAINPEAIVDWLEDGTGGFVWFKVKEQVDITTPLDKERVVIDRYWYYTQDGWWALNDDGKGQPVVVASGAWGPSGYPIVIWRISRSLVADAGATQRELYNVCSLIQEQERGTAFAMLSSPSPSGKNDSERTKRAGSDTVWWFDDQAKHRPEWMSPPPDVLTHLMAKVEALTGNILSQMGLDFDQGGGQTGMAFSFKMSKIVRLLQGLANALSRGEAQSLETVGRLLNAPIPDKVRVVWPTEFDAKDVEKEMDALERILDRVQSATAKVEAQSRMALTGMNDMDETTRTAIRKEVEEGVAEAEINETLGADQQPDEDGEPPDEGSEGEGDGVPDSGAR
jgi:hypothetical protein